MDKRTVRWAGVLVLLVVLLASGLPASAGPSWQTPGEASVAERLLGFLERLVAWSSEDTEDEEPPKAEPFDGVQTAEPDPSNESDLGPTLDPDG